MDQDKYLRNRATLNYNKKTNLRLVNELNDSYTSDKEMKTQIKSAIVKKLKQNNVQSVKNLEDFERMAHKFGTGFMTVGGIANNQNIVSDLNTQSKNKGASNVNHEHNLNPSKGYLKSQNNTQIFYNTRDLRSRTIAKKDNFNRKDTIFDVNEDYNVSPVKKTQIRPYFDVLSLDGEQDFENMFIDDGRLLFRYENLFQPLIEATKIREYNEIIHWVHDLEKIVYNKDQNLCIEGVTKGNNSHTGVIYLYKLYLIHNQDDDSLVNGFFKQQILNNNSKWQSKVQPERETSKMSVVYDIFRGRFNQKEKEQFLTTVDIIDLDLDPSKPWDKFPTIDPNQYIFKIINQKIKGHWITSNIDSSNIIEGEIVKIRQNNQSIFSYQLLPKIHHDIDLNLIIGLENVVRQSDLITLLVVITREVMKGKCLLPKQLEVKINECRQKVKFDKNIEERVNNLLSYIKQDSQTVFNKKMNALRN